MPVKAQVLYFGFLSWRKPLGYEDTWLRMFPSGSLAPAETQPQPPHPQPPQSMGVQCSTSLVLYHGTQERERDVAFLLCPASRTTPNRVCHPNSLASLSLYKPGGLMLTPRVSPPLRLNVAAAPTSSVYLILLSDHNRYHLMDFDYVSLRPSVAEGIGTACSQTLVLGLRVPLDMV